MSNYNLAGPFQVQPSTVQTAALTTPTAPSSTSAYQAQAFNVLFTPQSSGRVLALFTAQIAASQTTIANGMIIELFYCPVTAGVSLPAVNTAIPSSAVVFSTPVQFEIAVALTTASDLAAPIALNGVALGLTLGQQYYFDVAAKAITNASDNTLVNGGFTIIEL